MIFSGSKLVRLFFFLACSALLWQISVGHAADPKAKDPERLAKVRADLKSPDAAVRLAAVRSLPHSSIARDLLPDLKAALHDSDGDVRSWAATIIGPEGAASVPLVPELIAQLEADSFKEARETAARALGRIGRAVPTERRAVASLVKASTSDSDSVTRVVSLGALAMMEQDTPQRIKEIGAYLRHEDALTRMKSAHALGQLGESAKMFAADIAKALEKATEPHQRAYLARAVGQVGDREYLSTLYAELAKETDPQTVGEMRGAINRLGGKVPPKSE